jgi:polar amino acid transport system substrate-binding protein
MRFVKRILIFLIALSLSDTGIMTGAVWAEGAAAKAGTGKRIIKLVCSDQPWYPYLYSGKEIGGIHIDIVKKALENAGYSVSIEAMPMARCIKMAERDMVDGIISVAYDKNYARFLEYPRGSSEAKESEWRIMQIDDVVVTNIEDDFEFDGDMRSLPQPVCVFMGEPILQDLKDAGLETESGDTNWINYAKFIRDKKGCLVTTSVVAEKMDQDESFRKKLTIQAVPLRSCSYYLAFSWGSHLTHDERIRIWNEIAKLRDDHVFMLTTFARY